jgi:hypothetical protein
VDCEAGLPVDLPFTHPHSGWVVVKAASKGVVKREVSSLQKVVLFPAKTSDRTRLNP